MTGTKTPFHPIDRLLEIMARLRDPDTGCPWDLEQSFRTIAPYTIEEAYEVADAIEQDDMEGLKGELGDLLFQVVFYAQMSQEAGRYGFAEIVEAISDKMEARHPHVFGDASVRTEEQQTRAWEEQKAAEREAVAKPGQVRVSALDGVARALPALMRAEKLQKRATRIGFDWPDIEPVYEKVQEEIAEVRAARSPDELEDEIGDLIFATVNLARHHGIDPEVALRRGNDKFEKRFRSLEQLIEKDNKSPEDYNIDQLEELWRRVKADQD